MSTSLGNLQAIMETHPRLEYREELGPFVYFIRWGDYVKIGTSINPERRLGQIGKFKSQTTGPPSFMGDAELICCIPGSAVLERMWHREFKSQRCSGEWFILNGALRQAISEAVARHIEIEVELSGEGEESDVAKAIFLRKVPVLDRITDPEYALAYDTEDVESLEAISA